MTVTEPNVPSLERIQGAKANNELLAYCNSAYKACRQARLSFERQWYTNLAFYFGRHYVQWMSTAITDAAFATEASFSKLYEPAAPSWRVRLVTNKVRSIIRSELAKVTKERPRGFVIPSTTDSKDLAAARAGDALIDFFYRELTLAKIMRRASFWNLICGTAFIKDWYDETAVDAGGNVGQIFAEHVTPFHLLVPDLQEEELENQPYVIHALAKPADWVYDAFGVRIAPDSNAGAGLLEQRFLSALGVNPSSAFRYVSIKEMWVKPCNRFPQGGMITWAGDQIVDLVEEWPYKHKDYPFSKLDHIPTGRFYGESVIVDLIPLQREFNRTRSQVVEAKNRMSKPQLVAVRGSIDANKVTSEPGLIIFYKAGYQPPTPLPLQSIPSYVIEEYERINADMQDIASIHEISKGNVPPGVTAATAISLLQEQDDSRFSTTISSLEEAAEKLGRHFLHHVVQFWAAERQISVIGDNGQFDAMMFSQANLKGNTDYRVEAGSATPTSRAGKQAFIMELMKNGYIAPDRGLRYLNMAETGKLYEEMMLDARAAQRENIRMMAGEEVPVNRWDVDPLHVLEHDNHRKTQEFESASDKIKMIFHNHDILHKQRNASKLGLQLDPENPMLDALIQNPAGAMQALNTQQAGQGTPPLQNQGAGGAVSE